MNLMWPNLVIEVLQNMCATRTETAPEASPRVLLGVSAEVSTGMAPEDHMGIYPTVVRGV